MKHYDCVFSFGEGCLCASILSKLGLRHFSSPFDWMYGATFEERMNILLNNFDNFLNKEDMVFVGQRDNPEPCDIYFNKRTQICFNHDFPLNVPLEKSFFSLSMPSPSCLDPGPPCLAARALPACVLPMPRYLHKSREKQHRRPLGGAAPSLQSNRLFLQKMALALLYANAILFVKQALFVLLRPLPGVPAAPVAIFVRPITLACTA